MELDDWYEAAIDAVARLERDRVPSTALTITASLHEGGHDLQPAVVNRLLGALVDARRLEIVPPYSQGQPEYHLPRN